MKRNLKIIIFVSFLSILYSCSHEDIQSGELFHIKGDFRVDADSEFGFKIHGTEIIYNAAAHELRCMDQKAPLNTKDGSIYFNTC